MTVFSEHSYCPSYLPSPPHGADQGDLCTMQARKAYGSCDLCHCRLSHSGGDSGHHARHAIWRCWYASSPLPVPSTSYLMPCRRHRAWSSFHRSHRRRSHDTEIQQRCAQKWSHRHLCPPNGTRRPDTRPWGPRTFHGILQSPAALRRGEDAQRRKRGWRQWIHHGRLATRRSRSLSKPLH